MYLKLEFLQKPVLWEDHQCLYQGQGHHVLLVQTSTQLKIYFRDQRQKLDLQNTSLYET